MKDTPTEKKKILIVEDDLNIAAALQLKFTNAGFDVRMADNGETALQILRKDRVDAILLDILLPKKNGFEVLQELPSTLNKGVPVEVLTCLGQEENLKKATDLGARHAFVKSQISLSDVVKAVQENLA